MEIIDKYKKEIEEDCKLDMLNLRDAQLKLPGIKHKWAARLIHHKISKAKIKKVIADAKATIVDKQLSESKVKVSQASLERHAEEHKTVIQLREKLQEEEFVIMYLDKVEQILRSVTFDIKNLTEILKLEQL